MENAMKSRDMDAIRTIVRSSKTPPIPKRKLGPSKKQKADQDRPMTQEERNAVRFEAINANFDWSNDEWAITWLPEERRPMSPRR
jgi:hypothetical protein